MNRFQQSSSSNAMTIYQKTLQDFRLLYCSSVEMIGELLVSMAHSPQPHLLSTFPQLPTPHRPNVQCCATGIPILGCIPYRSTNFVVFTVQTVRIVQYSSTNCVVFTVLVYQMCSVHCSCIPTEQCLLYRSTKCSVFTVHVYPD